MVRESKNYIADNLIELVDDLTAWDAYPWGEYFWRASYRKLVNVISRHEVVVMLKNKTNVSLTKKTKKIDSSKKIKTYNVYGFVWSLKKDLLVIPRGLAWSKIGKFEKGDYGALFAEWSNPILSMAPTSTELLQPWLIHSMDYFRTLLVDGQPNDPITASHQGDGDPSIVLKELDAVKQRMNAIERFIKSRNDNLSEDSVAKQFVEKEIESSDVKPDSAISNSIGNQLVQHLLESPNGKMPESSILDVLNGVVSFDKKRPNIYHCESSKNEALSKEFDPKEYDNNVHESCDGKVSKSKIINVLTGEVSCDKYAGGFYDGESSKLYYTNPKEYPSSSMTQLLQAANHKSMYEYAGFDFDNTENDSLSNMVKTRKEEIHLDRLEIVDDPFDQTPVKQNSE
ncbi:hypothetical protein Tco_1012397, partial [Tanacetum coccineum]